MKGNFRRYMAALLLVAVVVALPLQRVRAEQSSSDPALSQFLFVYDLVKQYYVHDVDPAKLMAGATRGMLATLDPYSTYFTAQEYKDFDTQLQGKFGGVGIQPEKVGDYITVVAPLKDSPADKAGIKAGDIILAVDGKNVVGANLEDVLPAIRGDAGTQVTLTLQRDKKTFDVTLTRYEIVQPSMDSKQLGDGVYYIAVYSFSQDVGKNLQALVGVYRSQGAKGIVLDLRNNPGGYLDEGVKTAETFIGSGPIVQLVDRTGQKQVITSSSGVTPLPVAVLVNGGTASAAEIVAGALQDTGIGTLVGTHTFGKGLVQSLMPLSDGSVIKMTTMKYQTPKGRDILFGQGLTPDVLVDAPVLPAFSPLIFKRALSQGAIGLDVQSLQQRLADLGYSAGDADGIYGSKTAAAVRAFQQAQSLPVTGSVDEATIKALNDRALTDYHKDPQLDKALEVLKDRISKGQ